MQVIAPGLRIVEDYEQLESGIKADFFIDPHIHSNVSFDVLDPALTPEFLFNKTRSQNLVPVMTDHNAYEGNIKIESYLENEGIDSEFVPGVEFSIKPKRLRAITPRLEEDIHSLHINVFQLTIEQFAELRNMSYAGDLDEFIRYCRRNDLPHVLNHIFWSETVEKLNWRLVPLIVKKYFKVIELNAKMTKEQNDLTVELARELGVSLIGASDTHIGTPGRAFTFAHAANFDEFWWEKVVPGRAYVARADFSVMLLLDEVRKYVRDFLKNDVEYLKTKNFILNSNDARTVKILRKILYSRLHDSSTAWKVVEFFLDNPRTYALRNKVANLIYLNREKKFMDAIAEGILAICQILEQHEEFAAIEI